MKLWIATDLVAIANSPAPNKPNTILTEYMYHQPSKETGEAGGARTGERGRQTRPQNSLDQSQGNRQG